MRFILMCIIFFLFPASIYLITSFYSHLVYSSIINMITVCMLVYDTFVASSMLILLLLTILSILLIAIQLAHVYSRNHASINVKVNDCECVKVKKCHVLVVML